MWPVLIALAVVKLGAEFIWEMTKQEAEKANEQERQKVYGQLSKEGVIVLNSDLKIVLNQDNVTNEPVFEERGDLAGDKILIIGRTGVGKSSLVNMLLGEDRLAVGPVASTTRWIEGVRLNISNRNVILVDTPGYGEAMTSQTYTSGLLKWVRNNKSEMAMVIHVIQADAKAHAEDKEIVERVAQELPNVPFIIVFNQIDKLPPIRFSSDQDRSLEQQQLKEDHVTEKAKELCRQFGISSLSIIPTCAVEADDSRKLLLSVIEKSIFFDTKSVAQVTASKAEPFFRPCG